jgi:hypothetical protein
LTLATVLILLVAGYSVQAALLVPLIALIGVRVASYVGPHRYFDRRIAAVARIAGSTSWSGPASALRRR